MSVKFNLSNFVEFCSSGFIFLRLNKRNSKEERFKNGRFLTHAFKQNNSVWLFEKNSSCFAVNALIEFRNYRFYTATPKFHTEKLFLQLS